MKKLLLAGAATLALSANTFAADPVVFEEVVVAPPPADIWDGLFVGVLGGYGWAQDGLDVHSYSYHDMDINVIKSKGVPDAFLSDEDSAWASDSGNGWWGGGLLGFNIQNGNFVFGVEGDISFSDIEVGSASASTSASVFYEPPEPVGDGDDDDCQCAPGEPGAAAVVAVVPPAPLPPPVGFPLSGSTSSTTHASANIDWYGTARLKAGWASGNFLAYVTGGLAFGEVKLNGTVNTMHTFGNGQSSSQSTGFSDSSSEVGWTLGVGADVAVTPNFFVGAFYRYVDLGSVSGGASNADSRKYGAAGPHVLAIVDESGLGTGSASADANFHAVGLRAAFKFGGNQN